MNPGAGKSTIIKMLIDRERARVESVDNSKAYDVPVPGLVDDNIPTTGDVHLYEDPGTCWAQLPILYADCEGLTGGEARPQGLTCRDKLDAARRPGQFVKNKLRKRLAWAEGPSMQSREFAVRTLFPRILYTLSDVVVFVLREVRTFQTDVLLNLVRWAAESIDKSINQPSRPHIIIVVNATDINMDENQWNPTTATRRLLDDYQDSIHQVPALREIIGKLSTVSQTITTTKELLEYFYSSVSVYVTSAYDHFSRRLDKPFDFAAEARRHAPLPRDFGGHVLDLILSMYGNYDTRPGRAKDLFVKLSRPIASCIVLDTTRDKTQGTYSAILRHTYHDQLLIALQQFCNYWLRCSFQKGGQKCHNVRSSHEKGHQAHTGEVLSYRGSYESTFVVEDFFPTWYDEIDKHVKELQERAQQDNRDESVVIADMHIEVMKEFYKAVHPGRPPSEFRSNSTCLCCVSKIPDNVLTCGHILCKKCIQAYGDKLEQGLFKLHYCPLHPHDENWVKPVLIRFKPAEAGVRILCLDGGGVRGIVELAILRAIEEALGHHIPIQNFFDLIVGTSTGGIVALGLGVKRWSVSECIKNFKDLCGYAFTSRAFKPIAVFSHRSYYKTRPLEKALQSAFDSTTPLYGGLNSTSSTAIRVAVTSTMAVDKCPVVLANYNTEGKRDGLPYKFVRPRDPTSEMKVWEAARATAAAPMYFKPFTQDGTSTVYTDGGIDHNCPAIIADHERRLLWGDVSDWAPDIFLSIGTGLDNAQRMPSHEALSPTSSRSRQNAIIEDQLNCEQIWKKYLAKATAPGQADTTCNDGRNIRLNVMFEHERPSLDKVEELENMERYVHNKMKDDLRINDVANRLVASCFYYETIKATCNKQLTYTGRIECRFDEGSQELKGLGRILRDRIRGPNFLPSFFLEENYGSEDQREYEVPIPTETIHNMCNAGFFTLPSELHIDAGYQSSVTRLSLCLEPYVPTYGGDISYRQNPAHPLFPISGFPRVLSAQHSLHSVHLEENLGSEGEDASGSQDPEVILAPKPTLPHLAVPKGGFKGSKLYKSISQMSLSPKARSPDGSAGDYLSGKEETQSDLSGYRSSSKLANNSQSSRLSSDTTESRG
ncbi:Ff.00g064450.m01.CDS01 [Fusarium sp. VM40]|nr:Ff.00g064450.m01.CDS01 [Fusarium sp. VM40]